MTTAGRHSQPPVSISALMCPVEIGLTLLKLEALSWLARKGVRTHSQAESRSPPAQWMKPNGPTGVGSAPSRPPVATFFPGLSSPIVKSQHSLPSRHWERPFLTHPFVIPRRLLCASPFSFLRCPPPSFFYWVSLSFPSRHSFTLLFLRHPIPAETASAGLRQNHPRPQDPRLRGAFRRYLLPLTSDIVSFPRD